MKEENKLWLRRTISGLGIVSMFYITVLWAVTLAMAYMTTEKAVIVSINTVGEADIEMFVMLPIVLIMGLYAVIESFRRFK